MSKRKKLNIVLLVIILMFALLSTACAPARRPAAPENNVTPDRTNIQDANRRAETLAAEAAKVQDVKSATVVLSGDTAIVGLNIPANVEKSRTEQIKQDVASRLKQADTGVKNVSIATDPDTVTRIRNIARGIADGRPVSEFAKELGEITRRITPTVK